MTKINIHNSKLLRRNLKLDKKGITVKTPTKEVPYVNPFC